MTTPNIHLEVIETNDADQTVTVRYWSDLLSPDMLANDVDEQGQPRRREDGKPLRCRTDVNIGIDPTMDPASPEFTAWAMQWANVQFFQIAEDALAGTATPLTNFLGGGLSLRQTVEREVQLRLDAMAKQKGYDNIVSVCSYATSKKRAAEAQHAVDVRDAAWDKCYEILDEVIAGTRPVPTLEEVLAELPSMAWPA